jgi:DNA-binding transcriptional regulator YdaS (Cro superfamily)
MSILSAYLSQPEQSVAAFARALSVPAPLVTQWHTGARAIPVARCAQIERVTNGLLRCEALRPDVSWHRVIDSEWPHPEGRPLIDVTATEAA